MIYKVATGKTQARDHMSVLGGTTGTHMAELLVAVASEWLHVTLSWRFSF